MTHERHGLSEDQILQEAAERYGENAEFAYVNRAQRRAVMMTLEEAMSICGQHIASADPVERWSKLDGMYKSANKLRSEGLAEGAKAYGKIALDRIGQNR